MTPRTTPDAEPVFQLVAGALQGGAVELGHRPPRVPVLPVGVVSESVELAPERRRALFAYAAQDVRLIDGSVRDNLRLADPNARDEALWAVLEDAALSVRFRNSPLGLDTPVGADGQALSGGERRRLGLARAYLRPAPWLVLDEPTEGLDFATEAQVLWRLQQRLARTGQGLLLVSHRPSPAALCEQVVGIEGVDGERRMRLAPRRNASQPSPLAMA